MADKKREALASKVDEVARNQIWREQLRTEYVTESALTPFQLNPKTLKPITLKPTQTHPADFGKTQDDCKTRELAAKLRQVTKRPNERYARPMTESQRIGWLQEMARKETRPLRNQRSSCDVTKFAAAYCTMAGCSPFADKSTL